MQGLKWGMWQHWFMWTPVGLLWFAVSFFDSETMRAIFSAVVQFSVMGPFGGYWLALVYLFDNASETGDWGNWKLWLTVPVWLAYTFVSMLMQVALVPKVMRWIDTAPIQADSFRSADSNACSTSAIINSFN